MRVLVDLRCLQAPPPRGGVARYAEEMTRALLAADAQRASPIAWTLYANGAWGAQAHLPTFNHPHAQWHVGRWPNKACSASALLRLDAWRWPHADVVWLPNLAMVPRLAPRTKLVVTVHDLSFAHFADCCTVRERLWHRAVRPRELLTRADVVVAVSETTKRDVVETYGVPEEKVRVVYPGVDHRATQQPALHATARITARQGTPYVLALSEHSPRKNLDGLIAAFAHLPGQLHLIIAGKPGSASRMLRQRIARAPTRERIHVLEAVTEHERTAILAGARCFAVPSFWEGFGFPPLEAMAAGVPVVAAAAGSLPEVLGDAAILCDPLDPADIARALTRACDDATLRATVIARGHVRTQRFTWAHAAQELLALLQ